MKLFSVKWDGTNRKQISIGGVFETFVLGMNVRRDSWCISQSVAVKK